MIYITLSLKSQNDKEVDDKYEPNYNIFNNLITPYHYIGTKKMIM